MAEKLTDAQIEAIARRVQGQLAAMARAAARAGWTRDRLRDISRLGAGGPPPHLSYVGRAGRATPAPAAPARTASTRTWTPQSRPRAAPSARWTS